MKKILQISLVLIFTITLFNASTVSIDAKTLSDLYGELQNLEGKKQASVNAKNYTEAEIATKKNEIEVSKVTIAQKGLEIDNANASIIKLKDDVVQKGIEIEDLLVYYQTNKEINEKISFIVEGKSITESIHRNNVFTQFTDASNDKILEYEQMQVDLANQIEQLKVDMVNLEELTKQLDQKVLELYGNLESLSKEEFTIDESIEILKSDIAYYEELGCETGEDLQACIARTTPAAPPASGFVRPVVSAWVTSEWGYRPYFGDFHTGIDLAAGGNPPVYAAASGIVASSGYGSVTGNYVVLHHNIGGVHYSTYYGHLASPPYVGKGEVVNINTQLGNMGTTGMSTGDHLHFQINDGWMFIDYYSIGARSINPRMFINFPDTGGYFSSRY